ncbi:unnamed protein product [Eruca vesicaria subsp. sativa]|uniref:Uncharacterized protein n=1 Tax=Eruca vesicaria subsp. sativa TaxID=29727 RepID=A0ABC8M096_ERUVS|nr:unnamed protein product [Eruca vesicaria subsp. sativa]
MPPNLQISLNLSTNLFDGPIPSTFSQLDRLEVLDLSNNKFSGEIPDSLTNLISLRQLILSNNQLIGNTPKFTHNVSIDVTGNSGITVDDRVFIQTRPSGESKLVLIVTLVAIGIISLVAVIIIVIMLKLSRRLKGVNIMQVDPDDEEDSTVLPEVNHGKLLTSNALHKSNINFAKAVEAVAHPENALF